MARGREQITQPREDRLRDLHWRFAAMTCSIDLVQNLEDLSGLASAAAVRRSFRSASPPSAASVAASANPAAAETT